jgi:hypothetical protein
MRQRAQRSARANTVEVRPGASAKPFCVRRANSHNTHAARAPATRLLPPNRGAVGARDGGLRVAAVQELHEACGAAARAQTEHENKRE